MSDHTMKLAALGARVMALWGFDRDSGSDDRIDGVEHAILVVGLNERNTTQVRQICAEHALNPHDYGDTAPELTEAGTTAPVNLATLQLLHSDWDDAKRGDSGDAEQLAAHDLIDELFRTAGITERGNA